jgi:hypothetical protein
VTTSRQRSTISFIDGTGISAGRELNLPNHEAEPGDRPPRVSVSGRITSTPDDERTMSGAAMQNRVTREKWLAEGASVDAIVTCVDCRRPMERSELRAPVIRMVSRVGAPNPPTRALPTWRCSRCGRQQPRLNP